MAIYQLYGLYGPKFFVGDKVRIKASCMWLFTHYAPELTQGTLTIESVSVENVKDYPDGMPYTEEFSYQCVTIAEFSEAGREVAACNFEPA